MSENSSPQRNTSSNHNDTEMTRNRSRVNSTRSNAQAGLSKRRELNLALGLDSTGAEDDYYHEDHRIDYTNAFLKEKKHSQEILSKLRPDISDFDKVLLGPTEWNYDDEKMNSLAKKQFVFDLLPSFEMLHSMQNTTARCSFENPDEHDYPPDYFNNNIHGRIGSIAANETHSNVSSPSSGNASSTSLSSLTSGSDSQQGSQITAEDYEDTSVTEPSEKDLLDKSHLLPNYDSTVIDVGVHVTRDVPHPLKANENESMLKEYTSGDVVHGYVTVHNTSSKAHEFQMFHVTLDGYILVLDPSTKRSSHKRFLNMVDISASWSYGTLSPAANFNYKAYAKDEEGYLLGLPNDRILQPKTKYKKFFAFKIPYKLLDNTCRHELEIHTLLPPSFGVDRVKKRGKYANIEINPLLHYGHSGVKGSPILTHDLSGKDLSISYGINAKLISFHPRRPRKLCVLKQNEYHLRFIPYGFAMPLFSSKSALNNLTSQIEHGFEIAHHVIELKQKNKDVSQEDEDEFIRVLKDRQLQSVNSVLSPSVSNNMDAYFPLRNKNSGNRDFARVESISKYLDNEIENVRSSFLKSLKLGAGKKKSSSGSSTPVNGLLTISSKIPKDGLPYISPNLLRKTNEVSKLNEMGTKNHDNLSSSLSANEKKKLSSLKLDMTFTPSDHTFQSVNPAELKNVKASLVVLNISSTSPIPIKLSSDFITQNESEKVIARFQKYHEEYKKLLDKFGEYELDLQRHVDKYLYQDIVAMKNLHVESTIVDAFNYSIKSDSEWQQTTNPLDSNKWTKKVELSLELKNDIPETLVPNFQTCLLSRVYSIQLDFKFKNGHTCQLVIPIRLRSFDDL